MDLKLLLEAERRGILPPDKAKLLDEARKRGLVPASDVQPKGIMQTIKENVIGDNDPTTQNFGEKVGTFLNKGAEAMTFGLAGDEANAAIAGMIPGGMGYDERLAFERQQEALMEESNPGAMLGAEIGGAVAGALLPGGAIGTLGKGAGTMARIGASAAAGAGMGGTYGFMEGEGMPDRVSGAATGATIGGLVGAAAPAVGAGVQKLADNRAANRAIQEAVATAPTTEGLRSQGRAAYDAIEGVGLNIRPERVQDLKTQIANALRGEGAAYTGAERVLPGSSALLGAVDNVGAGANTVPFNELDMFRRYANNAAAGAVANNPNDARIASGVVERLDDFVMGLKPDDVDSGDVKVLQELLPKARNLWSRMSRSDLIDNAIEAGSNNYQSGAASGIKNQFRRILNNPKLIRGFSDAERKMIQRVVNGTLPEQLISYLGSGLGMVAQTVAGGAMGAAGGIPGILLGSAAGAGVGAGARRLTENIVNKNAEIARALVASGRVPQLPVASPANRAISEALLRRTGAAVPQ
jgi:hypothetical protein